MLERFIYTNNFNETLEFGKDKLFVNENDLRDFAWGITSKNNKISGFKKGIVSKTIPVILKCDTEAEGLALRNQLFEVFEKDVLAMKHGKIHIGDYYLRCYITGSKKTEYLNHMCYMLVSLTVQTDYPEWVRETEKVYQFNAGDDLTLYLNYPHRYKHDYGNFLTKRNIENTAIAPCNFIMTIYGAISNPTILIAGHEYTVNVEINEDEYLVVNSAEKTVELVKNDGEIINCFNKRNKNSYLFEKIPVGVSVLSSTGNITFKLTLLDERSEPRWI